MTRTDRHNATRRELPSRIYGRLLSNYRIPELRDLLSSLGVNLKQKESKNELLGRLAAQEASLPGLTFVQAVARRERQRRSAERRHQRRRVDTDDNLRLHQELQERENQPQVQATQTIQRSQEMGSQAALPPARRGQIVDETYDTAERPRQGTGDLISLIESVGLGRRVGSRLGEALFQGSTIASSATSLAATSSHIAKNSEAATGEICDVCLEEKLEPASFPDRRITLNCSHEGNTCLDCVRQSITSQLETKQWNQLSCTGCEELLTFDDVKRFATKETFERCDHVSQYESCTNHRDRYDMFAVMVLVRDDPNFRVCLNPRCGGGQVHESGHSQPIITCGACQHKTCFSCESIWHEDQTCSEYQQLQTKKRAQDKASRKFLAAKSKICPNEKCGIHLQKNGGCDHFTC
jgi:hypothetical protein